MNILEQLEEKWKSSGPEREWSSVELKSGTEVVYAAGYPEGVVLRLGGEHVGFLTPGQAERLGARLIEMSKLGKK
jgi:hypothetical protein